MAKQFVLTRENLESTKQLLLDFINKHQKVEVSATYPDSKTGDIERTEIQMITSINTVVKSNGVLGVTFGDILDISRINNCIHFGSSITVTKIEFIFTHTNRFGRDDHKNMQYCIRKSDFSDYKYQRKLEADNNYARICEADMLHDDMMDDPLKDCFNDDYDLC